eukprot:2649375-Rhodomonas_salina.1
MQYPVPTEHISLRTAYALPGTDVRTVLYQERTALLGPSYRARPRPVLDQPIPMPYHATAAPYQPTRITLSPHAYALICYDFPLPCYARTLSCHAYALCRRVSESVSTMAAVSESVPTMAAASKSVPGGWRTWLLQWRSSGTSRASATLPTPSSGPRSNGFGCEIKCLWVSSWYKVYGQCIRSRKKNEKKGSTPGDDQPVEVKEKTNYQVLSYSRI